MFKKFAVASAVLMLGLTGAQAQTNDATIRSSLTEQGFTDIEISRDDGQLEVEAWRGEEKVEITYDLSTGNVIKSESERVRGGKAADDRDDRLDDQDDRDDDLNDRDDDDRDDADDRDDDRDDDDRDDDNDSDDDDND